MERDEPVRGDEWEEASTTAAASEMNPFNFFY